MVRSWCLLQIVTPPSRATRTFLLRIGLSDVSFTKFSISLFLVCFATLVGVASPINPTSPFDRFGDIKCEDEMARLDNLAIQLLNSPSDRAVITFYGGKSSRGRLPRRGDAAARAARLKPYLVQRRGVPASQVIMIDGGYREEWQVVIWIVPPGVTPPPPDPTVPLKQIKFRKGTAHPRDFRCRV
jgi:hypothetical protein